MDNNYIKIAKHFLELELVKNNFEFFKNDSNTLVLKGESGNFSELVLEVINIDQENKIKVDKKLLGKTSNQKWLAIVMITKKLDCSLYYIPTSAFLKPDDHSFLNSKIKKQPYWEVVLSIEAIAELRTFKLNDVFN